MRWPWTRPHPEPLLDEALRARLRALADEESAELARGSNRAGSAAPAAPTAGAPWAFFFRLAGAAGVAGLALVVVLAPGRDPSAPASGTAPGMVPPAPASDAAASRPTHPEAPAVAADAPPTRGGSASPACARWPGGSARGGRGEDDAFDPVELDRRARLVVAPGAAVDVEAVDPCRIHVALRRGRVAVHARDLGGGRLVVETPLGLAEVRGTVFDVDLQRPDRLLVRVAEGQVVVLRDGDEHAVGEGHTLRVDGGGRVREAPLTPATARSLRALVLAPARVLRARRRPVPAPRWRPTARPTALRGRVLIGSPELEDEAPAAPEEKP